MSDLHHIESEQSVLGGLLLDPKSHDRIDFLKEDDFYRLEHRTIYRHILLLLAQNKPVDVITVAESLHSSGEENQTGGLAYLGELASHTPSAANIKRYAEVVSEKRMLRDLLAVSNEIADLAQHSTLPLEERIDKAEGAVYALAEKRIEHKEEPKAIGSILSSVIEEIEDLYQRGGGITGVSTGFTDLDAKTLGLQPGDLIIIAGRPSMGKTAIALNLAEYAAIELEKPVMVFSMEMGQHALAKRSIASVGKINMGSIRSGRLTDEDFSRMSYAVGKLAHAKLTIDETPALSVTQIRSRARRLARKSGLAMIVVDYIQLARGTGDSREQEIASISRGLKGIAKELNVPVVALSQLSRKVEERSDKRPMMSDLRESGAIEQDADLILMMYRDEYYNPESIERGVAEVIIGKQRNGETGTVKLGFEGAYSRFVNLSEEAKANLESAREVAKPVAFRKRGFG